MPTGPLGAEKAGRPLSSVAKSIIHNDGLCGADGTSLPRPGVGMNAKHRDKAVRFSLIQAGGLDREG